MKDEVAAAVVFVTRLVKRNKKLSKDQYEKFSDNLTTLMVDKFKNHWHTERPHKGQAYRCIRINEFEPVDPILSQAASESGLVFSDLRLPCELTLWIDPTEVCVRFGETKSTFCTVASFKEEQVDNQALTLDLEEMIEEYNKKRQEEMDKLREFTGGKRSPLNIHGGYYKGQMQPFQGNMNFHHHQPPPHHHHHHHHHHHNNHHHHSNNKWNKPHVYTNQNGISGRSKVFNGLHIFHQAGDVYSHQQHSSSDEESNGYNQGATTPFQAADYVDTNSTAASHTSTIITSSSNTVTGTGGGNNNNNKVVISSSSSNPTATTTQQQQQSIHVSSSSPAPVNMKTGHSSHISQPSTTAQNKPDRYRWVKGAEPVKA